MSNLIVETRTGWALANSGKLWYRYGKKVGPMVFTTRQKIRDYVNLHGISSVYKPVKIKVTYSIVG